jgi:carbon-monoxide dehydrogenase iron sulfur subunit
MRKHLKTHPEKCTGCGTCMKVCSKTFFKQENPEKSSITVEKQPDGSHKITVCDQACKKCLDECPVTAISVNKAGVVVISKKDCVNCLACVAACPVGAMKKHDDDIYTFKCVACGACAKQCPEKALEIIKEEP